jgi:hypothetical protein
MKLLITFLLAFIPMSGSQAVTLESIPEELGEKIVENLTELECMKMYPEGFENIEDVKWEWISITHLPQRAAIYRGYFLFPKLDTARDSGNWDSGIAIKRNSPHTYTWNFDRE